MTHQHHVQHRPPSNVIDGSSARRADRYGLIGPNCLPESFMNVILADSRPAQAIPTRRA